MSRQLWGITLLSWTVNRKTRMEKRGYRFWLQNFSNDTQLMVTTTIFSLLGARYILETSKGNTWPSFGNFGKNLAG